MLKTLKRRMMLRLARCAVTRRSRPRSSLPLPALDAIRYVTILKPDGIGDFILATSLLRPLAERLGHAVVTLVVRKPSGSLARQQFPHWRVLELPGRETPSRNVFAQGGVRKQLRAVTQADLLIVPRAYRDYSDTILASWLPAYCKVAVENAYPQEFSWAVLPREEEVFDVLLPRVAPLRGEARDLADQRMIGGAILGSDFTARPVRPRLVVPPSDVEEVASILNTRWQLAKGAPYLVVCPGTSSSTKEYPPHQLAGAIKAALQGDMMMPVVVAGTTEDRRTIEPLCSELAGHVRLVDVSGYFRLPQHVALLAASRLAVVMDSCHVHIAGGLGVPCICILGGGQYGEFGPWGESLNFRWLSHPLECYGCQWNCIYQTPRCVTDLPSNRISEAIIQMLR